MLEELPSPPLHQPHDKLFKLGFSQPAEAASFLATAVPPELSAAIDWSSLTLQPGSFIDSQYRHQESDLLFSVRLAETTAQIYLLFEHQREQEPFIALRLLSYMVRIWQSCQVDKEAFLHRLRSVENTKIKDSAMTVAQQLRQEGRQEGRTEMQQRAILEALEIRFGRVPDGLAEEVLSISDSTKLTLLLRSAIRSASLEEFADSL